MKNCGQGRMNVITCYMKVIYLFSFVIVFSDLITQAHRSPHLIRRYPIDTFFPLFILTKFYITLNHKNKLECTLKSATKIKPGNTSNNHKWYHH